MTDEKKLAWRIANKEKKKEYDRIYNLINKERHKEIYESNKLDHYVVYLLPKENYVGITNQPKERMYRHNSKGKDTDNWIVLETAINKKEALVLERLYHKQGYLGTNTGKPKKNLTK
jgi:hypothetical protein